LIVVAPLIALLLVLGIYPKPVLDIVNPAVENTMNTIGQHDPKPTVPVRSPRPADLPRTAEGPR
jgi:NADH-quinone oxidoreductase subunit M